MAKATSWGDDKTDPGVPGQASDSTAVGPAPEPPEEDTDGAGRAAPRSKKIRLGPDNGDTGLDPADKTRVASIDDIAPPEEEEDIAPPEPEKVDATVVVSNPLTQDAEPELEGGGNADATMVTHNPLSAGKQKKKALKGRLVVVAGKEEGRVIELHEGAKVLGRSKDCDITLLDIQISRRHIEVTADHNGVRIEDLASGNGTFVNDEPVESVSLVHGDELAVGDHLLRFEEEGPVASALPALAKKGPARVAKRPAPGGAPAAPVDVVRRARQRRARGGGDAKKKKIMVMAGGGLILVAFFAIALGIGSDPDVDEPEGPTVSQAVQQLSNKGLQHFREARYDEALENFEQVLAEMPEHREAGRYVTATRREIAARDAIERGSDLLGREDFDGAREQFRRVDSESLRYDEAERLLQQANEAEARAIVTEADALLEEDELDDAREVYRRALSVIPSFADAEAGLTRVEEREEELASMSAAEKRRQAQLAAQRRRAAQRRARAQVRRALAVGERQFNQGDFRSALNTFNELGEHNNAAIRRQANRKAEAVRKFMPAYERGMSAAESRATEQAVNDLAVAENQAKIVNANGRIHNEVSERLADMYHLQGRIAFNSRRYQVAFRSWSQALRVDSNHQYASEGMEDLKELGEEIYMEAYMVRSLNRETAVRKFRQVIAMTPSSFEYHQRSKQRLAELGH